MSLVLFLLALPLLTALVVFPAVAWALLRQRAAGGRLFTLLTAVVMAWALAVLLAWSDAAGAELVAWERMALAAAALLPSLGLLTALRLSGRRLPWALGTVAMVPGLAAAALPYTSLAEPWLWRSLVPVEVAGLHALSLQAGPAFWVWWVGAGFALGLASALVLVLQAPGRTGSRAGAGLMAAAPLAPLVLAALALFGIGGVPGLDVTPLGFGASGLLLAWGLERRWLERRGPVEYREVFAGLGDGLVLVDDHGIVLDMNAAAERSLGVAAPTALRRPLSSIRPDLAGMGRESQVMPSADDGPVYEARGHPLQTGGRLIIVRDITARRAAEDALARRAEVLAATEAASRDFLREPDWAIALDGMLARLGVAVDATRVALLEFEAGVQEPRSSIAGAVPAVRVVRRWENLEAAAWPEGQPPYGAQLLRWAEVAPGFAGHVEEVPAHDRDVLKGLGVGYVALLPVAASDEVGRLLVVEWGANPPTWLPLVVDTLRAAPAALEAAVGRRAGELAGERSRAFQASLLDATRELLGQQVTPDFYQTLLERAVETIPGAQAGCVLVRSADARFAIVASAGEELELVARLRFDERDLRPLGPDGDGPRLLIGDDLDRGVEGVRGRAAREAGSGPGPAATLAVPVVLDGRLEASLRLDNLERADGFPLESLPMAEAFGLQVAALLQRLRLEERRERAAAMNALLADLGRLLLVGGPIDGFFPMLARSVLDVPGTGLARVVVLRTPVDGVAVEAYDAGGGRDAGLETALLDAGWVGGGRGPLARLDDDLGPVMEEDGRGDGPVPAYAAHPILLRGRPWGVIVFVADEPRTFDAQLGDMLAQLASTLELALVRQDDVEQRELQLARLEAVVATSEALRDATRRRDVVGRALLAVLEMTRADVCNLFLIDEGADALRLVGSRALPGRNTYPVGELMVPRGRGLVWRALDSGRTLQAQGGDGLAEAIVPAGLERPAAFIATPLRNGAGETVGVLNALIRDRGRSFERDDAGFLEAIALASGNALDRLALLEQSRAQAAQYRELYDAAKAQTAQLTLLDRVRGAVAGELDVQAVFATAAEAAVEVLGFERVGMFALQDGQMALQHQVGYTTAEELRTLREVADRVALRGRTPGEVDEPQDAAVLGLRRTVVPLVARDAVVGVLVAEGGEAPATDDGRRLLRAVGQQLGVAVERAQLHGAVRSSEQRFRLLAENMQDLVGLHAPDGTYQYLSPSWSTVLGYDPTALVGSSPYELVHPDDRDVVRTNAEQRLVEGQTSVRMRYRLRHADGHYVWIETLAQPVYDGEGQVVNLVTSSRDISERKRIEERLVRGALFDELTGLPNRALLLDRMRHALSRAARNEGWHFALLFLDLDRFKVVNDSLGHNAGDELLKALSARLKTCVRAADTVARLGGDEFCVLIEDVEGPEHATTTASRIQSALTEPFTLQGHDIFTSASIGIAFSSPAYHEPEELLRDADIAMYRAKAAGKARYAVFDEGMHARAFGLMQLETSLHRAAERGELFLEYQPIYRLAERELVGVEALVRWRHPQRGLVAPSEFVPLAEDSGLIVTIDRWVLGEAARQVAAWSRELPDRPVPVLSVNISARHFALDDVEVVIRAALEEAGIAASQLKLEIGEDALMSYPEAAAEALARLRDLGVLVQVDDFGTGFSSLKHLHGLRIDSLKIDGSFVRGIDDDEASQAVVRSILALASQLGIDAVAEGIEREEELATLRELGCAYGQGFLFAPPLPPDEVLRRLHAERAV